MATVKKARTKKTPETKEAAQSKPTASATSTSAPSQDLQESIRERAYELYRQRGGQDGMDKEDWARAEKEVLERFRGRTA